MPKTKSDGVRLSQVLVQHDVSLRDATVAFEDGTTVHLTVDPAKLTVRQMRLLGDAEQRGDVGAVVDMFFAIVKAWDLEDDDGRPLPLEEESLADWPIGLFMHFLQNIVPEGEPDPKAATST